MNITKLFSNFVLLCVEMYLSKVPVFKSQPPISQNVTLIENKVYADVISLDEVLEE